jgi:hypothetical protein
VWLGVELRDDIADGTFVEVAQSQPDDWTPNTSNDGITVMERNNNLSATITITVRQSSAVNAKLTAIRDIDRISSNQIGPMVCTDPSGPGAGSGFLASNCRILGKDAFTRGTSAGTVKWRFFAEEFVEADLGMAAAVPA